MPCPLSAPLGHELIPYYSSFSPTERKFQFPPTERVMHHYESRSYSPRNMGKRCSGVSNTSLFLCQTLRRTSPSVATYPFEASPGPVLTRSRLTVPLRALGILTSCKPLVRGILFYWSPPRIHVPVEALVRWRAF